MAELLSATEENWGCPKNKKREVYADIRDQ